MADKPEQPSSTNLRDANERRLANLKPFGPGNPGRPKGSKNKLSEDFFRDLYSTWEESGIQALKITATTDPVKFVTIVAGLMPKEFKAEVEHRSVMRMPEPAKSIDEWLAVYGPKQVSH